MPRKFALSAVSDAARATFREGPARRVAAVLVLIVVLVAVAAFVQPVRHQLALSFTRKPTQYSELYFTQLPRSQANQLRLGFRIANRGDHDVLGQDGLERLEVPHAVGRGGEQLQVAGAGLNGGEGLGGGCGVELLPLRQ